MAQNLITKPALASLSLLLLIALVLIPSEGKARNKELKETNMVFYMQDWESGSNITNYPVAGIPGTRWWILGFGTVFAIDDALTEEFDRNSTQIGRAHGIYVNSALDGSDLHLLMSFIFTNKRWNGSTLEIQGADRFYQKYREVSVVSGTGTFRLARGWVVIETVYLDSPGSNAILRCNATVLHY